MKCCNHNLIESVAECNECKKPICQDCLDVQNKFNSCPKCAENRVLGLRTALKRGLTSNILSLICFVIYLVIYIVELCTNALSVKFIIIGGLLVLIFGVLSIYLFVKTKKGIKKLDLIIASNKENVSTKNIDSVIEDNNDGRASETKQAEDKIAESIDLVEEEISLEK